MRLNWLLDLNCHGVLLVARVVVREAQQVAMVTHTTLQGARGFWVSNFVLLEFCYCVQEFLIQYYLI